MVDNRPVNTYAFNYEQGQLQKRLNQIENRISSKQFLNSEGLGNEIAFYIFDYQAAYEVQVREHILFLCQELDKKQKNYTHLNLFQVIINLLQEEDVLDDAISLQANDGDEELMNALKGSLEQNRIAQFIASNIKEDSEFVLLSGLGSAWPMIRGHSLLNALHAVIGDKPLVLFYPGKYSGLDIHPFDTLQSQNYYRAFELVPHS